MNVHVRLYWDNTKKECIRIYGENKVSTCKNIQTTQSKYKDYIEKNTKNNEDYCDNTNKVHVRLQGEHNESTFKFIETTHINYVQDYRGTTRRKCM